MFEPGTAGGHARATVHSRHRPSGAAVAGHRPLPARCEFLTRSKFGRGRAGGSPWAGAVALIILRQQDCRGAPVGLGDDPEPLAASSAVGGEEPKPLPEGQLVLAPVVLVDLAPVAAGVAADG